MHFLSFVFAAFLCLLIRIKMEKISLRIERQFYVKFGDFTFGPVSFCGPNLKLDT